MADARCPPAATPCRLDFDFFFFGGGASGLRVKVYQGLGFRVSMRLAKFEIHGFGCVEFDDFPTPKPDPVSPYIYIYICMYIYIYIYIFMYV